MQSDSLKVCPRLVRFAVAAVLALTLACRGNQPDGQQGVAPVDATSRSYAATAATPPVCGGTGAHDRHMAIPLTCQSCHPCGGVFGVPVDLVLPGGTSASGQVTHTTSGTTCSVGCHAPFGGTPQPISWTAVGPLACTSCHTQSAAGTTPRSSHGSDDSSNLANRAACQGCHVTDQHLSGHVRITGADGVTIDFTPANSGQVDSACLACHSGNGRLLAGRTPPLLIAYSSPTGDFHGSRAGTGWGGTLKAPYVRGQAALPCVTCHDAHASTNAFLFAPKVNGVTVPASVIDRAGVGAENLCASCHQGQRHQGCVDCHGVDPAPAGNACFSCHGHEGIVNFEFPDYGGDPHPGSASGCGHCHSDGWLKPPEYAAPVILASPPVGVAVTSTAATITWTTNEPATSYVEYGIAEPTIVKGDPALVTSHAVTLSGLSQSATYTFRVRTSDAMRNLTISQLGTFMTASPNAPPAPTLVPQGVVETPDPSTFVTFQWSPVTTPLHNPVQYRLVVDHNASFTSPVIDTGWITGTSWSAVLPGVLGAEVRYYWHVQARDATLNLPSPWSSTDLLIVVQYDPYGF